jgi:hypothetical protein
MNAIGPQYRPEPGAAGVRAASVLLEFKSLYKHHNFNQPHLTIDDKDKFL